MDQERIKIARRRGIYLLPNLLTTASLFAGFYAIVAGMKGHFDTAAIAIFIAMIADALDGRVARLVHASTEFGMQFDSLSDMMSFGIAPALVAYCWLLKDLGKFGWLIVFLYTACAALRLARFNIQTDDSDKRFFIGLPCPAAAGVIASMVWFFHGLIPKNQVTMIIVGIMILILAICMVSNILYRSFKELDLKSRTSFISLVGMVLIFIAISINPPLVLFLIFGLFSLSGPVMALYQQMGKARKANAAKKK